MGGGVMTSMRLRLVFSFSLLDFVGCSTAAWTKPCRHTESASVLSL